MMIWRSCTSASILLLFCAVGTSAVAAGEDSASAVLADCGSADLADSQVDSCLERARVLDETDPSAQLQSLEALLEQRETGQRTVRHDPTPLQSPSDSTDSAPAPDSAQPTVVESEHDLPPAAAEPDQSRSAASDAPASAMPDERGSDEEQGSVDAAGAETPPPGINDDQPPVADPPDDETARDQSDPPDEPQ